METDLFNIIYDVFSAEGGENPCMVLAASENMFHPTSAYWRSRILRAGNERLQQAIAALDR